MSILYRSAALFFVAGTLAAQNVDTGESRADVARMQSDATTGPLSGEVNGHAAASPNDSDLGDQEIVTRQQRYQTITVAVAAPVYYTSNAFLSRSNEVTDVVEAPGAAIYYQPRLTGTLYGLVDVRDQVFYYDRNDVLDFGDFAVDVGINLTLPSMENLILRAQYTYERLTEKDSFDAFFQNHAFLFNAEVPVSIGKAQLLSFGAAATIAVVSEPEVVRRNDYEGYVAYNLALTRAISIGASGRMVVRDYYHENSRVDVSELAALTATCAVTRYMSISALSTFAANQSSQSIFDYKVGNLGGSLVVGIKF